MNEEIKFKDKNIVKIAFDESGNTGQNLIDNVQRYYVLASINLSDEEVESSYDLMRGNASELHFVNMKKYKNSRKKIIEFLNLDLITDSNVKFSFSDKRFTIIGHLIDLLISRGALKQQIDVFKNGLDFVLQNAFLKSCIMRDDKELLMKVLNMFVLIVRERDQFDFWCHNKQGLYLLSLKKSKVEKYCISKLKGRERTMNLRVEFDFDNLNNNVIEEILNQFENKGIPKYTVAKMNLKF